MDTSFFCQCLKVRDNMFILCSQNRDRNNSDAVKENMMIFISYSCIAAQTESIHIESLHHGFPLSNVNSIFGKYWFARVDQSNICSSTSHIYYDSAFFPGEFTSAYHTGSRAAQKSFNRISFCHFFRHQCSIASYNGKGNIQMPIIHDMVNGLYKFRDQWNQTGV